MPRLAYDFIAANPRRRQGSYAFAFTQTIHQLLAAECIACPSDPLAMLTNI
jgi:hypothetical protein